MPDDERPDLDELTDLLETYSLSLQAVGSDLYRKAFANRGVADLTLVKLRYFELITRTPGITPSELSEIFNVRRASVTNVLQDLEGKDLVRRVKSSADRRVVEVYPTEAAKEIYDYRRLMYRHMADTITEALGADGAGTMARLMRTVAEHLAHEKHASVEGKKEETDE